MDFKNNCKKHNIETVEIKFDVTEEVYKCLLSKCNDKGTLPSFMRDMVDYFIINDTD